MKPRGLALWELPEAVQEAVAVMPNGCWHFLGQATELPEIRGATYRLQAELAPFTLLLPTCKLPECINPAHLEPTVQEQAPEAEAEPQSAAPDAPALIGVAAENAAKILCKHGHPLTGDNLYTWFDKSGAPHRMCMTCRRERKRVKR